MDVEVVFPDDCSAFYKATLLDIDVSGGKCLLSFEDGWKTNCWVELEQVRYPPTPAATGTTLDPSPGSAIEVLLPLNEGEPAGWWLATITKSKGEIAGIQLQKTGDNIYSDLVEHKFLRVPNENARLSELKFFQKEFEVPHEIREFCRDSRVHSNYRDKTHALSVTYDMEKQSLIVLTDEEKCLRKAELLIDMHLNDLSTQAALKSRTERVAQRLQTTTTPTATVVVEEEPDNGGIYEEKFYIAHELTGFAMGKQGRNVKQARDIPGVVAIDFDDFSSMFTIKAETKEAAVSAREIIDFVIEIVNIPRDLAGKVIGKSGNIVTQILEKSKLNNIKVVGDQEAKERKLNLNDVPFELVGRRTSVENARMMFDYHLEHLREVSSILKDRDEITRKLRDSGIEEPPVYYPRPNPPRGRGRGRGRQRQDGPKSRRNIPGRQREQQQEEEEEEERDVVKGDQSYDSDQSTDEERQREDNTQRADSPGEDGVGNVQQHERRRKKKNYSQSRRKNSSETATDPPPTTTTTSKEDEDWPQTDVPVPDPEQAS